MLKQFICKNLKKQGKSLSANDEYKDYSSVLSIQKAEIIDLMELCKEYGIDIKSTNNEKGKDGLNDCMADDKLMRSTEQTATKFVKTAVHSRNKNSREEKDILE